jgi:hypothetical protein
MVRVTFTYLYRVLFTFTYPLPDPFTQIEKLGIGFKDGLKVSNKLVNLEINNSLLSSLSDLFQAHFQKYDRDGSGSISSKEFRKVLLEFQIRVTDQQFAQIMNIFDLDGSNGIEFEEFVKVSPPPPLLVLSYFIFSFLILLFLSNLSFSLGSGKHRFGQSKF